MQELSFSGHFRIFSVCFFARGVGGGQKPWVGDVQCVPARVAKTCAVRPAFFCFSEKRLIHLNL